MAAIDDGDARAGSGESIRRPRARWAGTYDHNVERRRHFRELGSDYVSSSSGG
jgi:hypothetical protein